MAVAIGLFGNRFVDSFFASIFVLRSGNGEKDEKEAIVLVCHFAAVGL